MSQHTSFYPWTSPEGSPETFRRTLTVSEYLLALLNDHAQGHNCPSLGATIRVNGQESECLSSSSLQTLLRKAFIVTRRKYPTIACKVKHGNELEYQVEDEAGIGQWAEQTVQLVSTTEGWLSKYESISREAALPNDAGHCGILYLLIDPERRSNVHEFDLLLQMHHALVDGAGLRTIMNEILANIASDQDSKFPDGTEVSELPPATLDAAVISDEAVKQLGQVSKEIQLPHLPKPVRTRPGTGVVTYTFHSPGFLDKLKSLARAHQVKLTSVVQAALVTTIHGEAKPEEKGSANVVTGYDLRVANLKSPWGQRNTYVGPAVGMEMMDVPGYLLKAYETDGDIWPVAQDIQKRWTSLGQREDVAAASELRKQATGFILKIALDEMEKPTDSGFGLALNYVSDPPGENQFDGTYKGGQGTTLELDRYQLMTDVSPPKLSCRSHSWRGLLTLEISFSNKFNTKAAVNTVLDKWICSLNGLVNPDDI